MGKGRTCGSRKQGLIGESGGAAAASSRLGLVIIQVGGTLLNGWRRERDHVYRQTDRVGGQTTNIYRPCSSSSCLNESKTPAKKREMRIK